MCRADTSGTAIACSQLAVTSESLGELEKNQRRGFTY